MSDVIDATGMFSKIRDTRTRAQLTAIKHKKLMYTHRHALVNDIALVLMVEIQRPCLGDDVVDKFLDELQIYREHAAVHPHEFDDKHLIDKIAYGLTTQGSKFPTGAAFNRLTIEASKSIIPDSTKDQKFRVLLSNARNTSDGIALFREFCKLDEASAIIGLASTSGSQGSASVMAQEVAHQFVDTHIIASRSLISLNTQKAKFNEQRRRRENNVAVRRIEHNLRLVVNR